MRAFWTLSKRRAFAAAALVLLLSGFPGIGQERSSSPQFVPLQEQVRVERIVVHARAINKFGHPILGLSAADFRLRVDRKDVPVESVEWVDTSAARTEGGFAADRAGLRESPAVAPPGRLILLLFQWEVFADEDVVPGFVRMLHHAGSISDSLGPSDRVAVASFIGRLWIQQDFTTDRGKVRDALEHLFRRGTLPSSPGALDAGGKFSLAACLAEHEARSATSIEKALAAVGRALAPVPGPKSLLLFGWGMGRMVRFCRAGGCTTNRTFVSKDYEAARQSLVASDTAVFSLDITDLEPNSLRHGLERVAWDTGGFYMPTTNFPRLALQKVERTLNGHYVVVFNKPVGPRGDHDMQIDLVRHRGVVLHRRSYDDRSPT